MSLHKEFEAHKGTAENPVSDLHDLVIEPGDVPPRRIDDWLYRPLSGYALEGEAVELRTGLMVRMDALFTKLCDSPTFASLYKQCPDIGSLVVYFKKLDMGGGEYSAGDHAIALHADTMSLHDFFERQPLNVTQLAHEFRHAWQDKYLGRPKLSNINAVLMDMFLSEADAVAFQATVSWELKMMRYPRAWGYFSHIYPACAQAFEESVRKDESSLFNGGAQNAAFAAWLEDAHNINYYTAYFIKQIKERTEKIPAYKQAKRVNDYSAPGQDIVPSSSPAHAADNTPHDEDLRAGNKENKKFNPARLDRGGAMGFYMDRRKLFDELDSFHSPRDSYLNMPDIMDRSSMYYLSKIKGSLLRELEAALITYSAYRQTQPRAGTHARPS